jgi:hypothetical protein
MTILARACVVLIVALATTLGFVGTAPADELEGVNVNSPKTFAALPASCEAGHKCQPVSFGKKRPTIVAWGDSHMAQQLPGLIAQARARRHNLVTFVLGFCPPILVGTDGCASMGRAALAHITKLDKRRKAGPVTVVLGAYWDYYLTTTPATDAGRAPRAARLRADAPRVFSALDRLGVRVAAVATVPTIPAPPVEVELELPPTEEAPAGSEAAELIDLEIEFCTIRSMTCLRRNMLQHEATGRAWLNARLAQVDRHALIDTNPYLCTGRVCNVRAGDTKIYDDDVHLNLGVTARFAPAFNWVVR